MKRLLALFLSLLLAFPVGVAEGQAVSGETVLGRVTEVAGQEVTLMCSALSDMPDGEQPWADGEVPELPDGEQPWADGEVPGLPDGEQPWADGEVPELPDGGQPWADGEVPDDVFSSGEEMTITITDATAISVEEDGSARDGMFEDIAVGSIVRVIFGENGTVASLTALAGTPMDGFAVPGDAAGNGTEPSTIA